MAPSLPPRWLLAVIAVLIVLGVLYAVASISTLPGAAPNPQHTSSSSGVRKPSNRPVRKPVQERSATDMTGWCCLKNSYTCKSGLNPRSCKDAGGVLFSPVESQCKRLCKP